MVDRLLYADAIPASSLDYKDIVLIGAYKYIDECDGLIYVWEISLPITKEWLKSRSRDFAFSPNIITTLTLVAATSDINYSYSLIMIEKTMGEYFNKQAVMNRFDELGVGDISTIGMPDNIAHLATFLPNVMTKVAYPCGCQATASLFDIVIHLNDVRHDDGSTWSRERIADWLDELHDTGVLDLTFNVEV